jgi:hypothetical protein
MRLSIELDERTKEALISSAGRELRPLAWQALVLLRRALGLEPWPCQSEEDLARRRSLGGAEAAGQEEHQPHGGEASA